MIERPHVICHMLSSIDGGLHPSRYTSSPDGAVKDWNRVSERLQGEFGGQAWLVGRVTMAEMAKGRAHPPSNAGSVERPWHFADRTAAQFAVAVDTRGELHFRDSQVGGDHVVVLLGAAVTDSHLAELADDRVSYVVSERNEIDLRAALAVLRRELGIERLLLEGGATINGAFLAAGLVDELSVVVAPALHARVAGETIVAHGDNGLGDEVRLKLRSCAPVEFGLVHLCYDVVRDE